MLQKKTVFLCRWGSTGIFRAVEGPHLQRARGHGISTRPGGIRAKTFNDRVSRKHFDLLRFRFAFGFGLLLRLTSVLFCVWLRSRFAFGFGLVYFAFGFGLVLRLALVSFCVWLRSRFAFGVLCLALVSFCVWLRSRSAIGFGFTNAVIVGCAAGCVVGRAVVVSKSGAYFV